MMSNSSSQSIIKSSNPFHTTAASSVSNSSTSSRRGTKTLGARRRYQTLNLSQTNNNTNGNGNGNGSGNANTNAADIMIIQHPPNIRAFFPPAHPVSSSTASASTPSTSISYNEPSPSGIQPLSASSRSSSPFLPAPSPRSITPADSDDNCQDAPEEKAPPFIVPVLQVNDEEESEPICKLIGVTMNQYSHLQRNYDSDKENQTPNHSQLQHQHPSQEVKKINVATGKPFKRLQQRSQPSSATASSRPSIPLFNAPSPVFNATAAAAMTADPNSLLSPLALPLPNSNNPSPSFDALSPLPIISSPLLLPMSRSESEPVQPQQSSASSLLPSPLGLASSVTAPPVSAAAALVSKSMKSGPPAGPMKPKRNSKGTSAGASHPPEVILITDSPLPSPPTRRSLLPLTHSPISMHTITDNASSGFGSSSSSSASMFSSSSPASASSASTLISPTSISADVALSSLSVNRAGAGAVAGGAGAGDELMFVNSQDLGGLGVGKSNLYGSQSSTQDENSRDGTSSGAGFELNRSDSSSFLARTSSMLSSNGSLSRFKSDEDETAPTQVISPSPSPLGSPPIYPRTAFFPANAPTGSSNYHTNATPKPHFRSSSSSSSSHFHAPATRQLTINTCTNNSSLVHLQRSTSFSRALGPLSLNRAVSMTSGSLISPSPSSGLSQFSEYCTPQDQPVREKTEETLKEEMAIARVQQQMLEKNEAAAGMNAGLIAATRNHLVNGGIFENSNSNKRPRTAENTFDMRDLGHNLPSSQSYITANLPSNEPLTVEINPFLPPSLSTNASALSKKRRSAFDLSSSSPSSSCMSRFDYDYDIIRTVGSGSFGDVLQCRHRLDGCYYAIKRLKRPISGLSKKQTLLHEVHAISSIMQNGPVPPSVVKYQHCWIEQQVLYIAMEWCGRGSLASQINQYVKQQQQAQGESVKAVVSSTAAPPCWSGSEQQLRDVALQIGKALAYLHDVCHLAHMDVKPENILEASESIYKLGDFGLCGSFGSHSNSAPKSSNDSSSTSAASSSSSSSSSSIRLVGVGDKRYLSIEAIEEDRLHNLPAVDIFAFGVTLYELASGAPLPKSELEQSRIKAGDISGIQEKVSSEMYELIRCCIHPDPNERISAREVVEQIEEWRNGQGQRMREMEAEIVLLRQQVEQERINNAQLQQYLQQSHLNR